jgi:hypothetical protein
MKVIITENYANLCECGKTVELRKYIWFREGEDKNEALTLRDKISQKHKMRAIFLGICECGNIFREKMKK